MIAVISQPENILLDSKENVKISDFGFSAFYNEQEGLSGTVMIIFVQVQVYHETGVFPQSYWAHLVTSLPRC